MGSNRNCQRLTLADDHDEALTPGGARPRAFTFRSIRMTGMPGAPSDAAFF
jgi:hypothetical protein